MSDGRKAAWVFRDEAIQAILDGDRQRAVDSVDRLHRLVLSLMDARTSPDSAGSSGSGPGLSDGKP